MSQLEHQKIDELVQEMDKAIEAAKEANLQTVSTHGEIEDHNWFYMLPEDDKKEVRKPHLNNFCLLFEAIRRERNGIEDDSTVRIYLRRKAEERCGPRWNNFLQNNMELINAIVRVLEEYNLVNDIVRVIIDAKLASQNTLSNLDGEFEERIVKELDLYPKLGHLDLLLPVQLKLNYLLQMAEIRMSEVGIDAYDEFY